jgi:hypothetical protein
MRKHERPNGAKGDQVKVTGGSWVVTSRTGHKTVAQIDADGKLFTFRRPITDQRQRARPKQKRAGKSKAVFSLPPVHVAEGADGRMGLVIATNAGAEP